LADYVQTQVASVLGHAAASVPRTQGFAHLGMDSLASIELRLRLEQGLECRLPTTVAFDFPNVEALSTHLLEVTDMKADRAQAGLNNLRRDELAALLARELESSVEENHS